MTQPFTGAAEGRPGELVLVTPSVLGAIAFFREAKRVNNRAVGGNALHATGS
jgi:hypothetical protein